MIIVKDIVEVYLRLKSERTQLDQLFEEIAEVLSPNRIGFVGGSEVRQMDKIFDTQPLTAKRGLVNAVGEMSRPKSSKWFGIVPKNEALMEIKAVKEWVDFAQNRQWNALYNPRAKLIDVTGEVDDDLVTFGTGAGFLGERSDRSGLLFRSFHLKSVFLDVDADNSVDTVYIREDLTARQAAIRWREENLGKKTREALKDSEKTGEKFEFVWRVTKRYEFDPRLPDNKNMPYESVVVDVACEHLVVEEGFKEFPFFFPRWDTRSGEIYGRGPGVMALPDVLTSNSMGKTMLSGLHRAVAPPWLFPSDSMVEPPQLKPDTVSYYDAVAVKELGLRDPFKQLTSGANIPWGLNAQQAVREQIHVLFYKNILNLPINAPTMTATEVIQRREEFIREIGAVFGRLETDYTGPIIERSFNIMLRRGAFGDRNTIPKELRNQGISFRFASPIEKAKRQIEEASVMQGINSVMQIGAVKPEILNRFDWDNLGKFIAKNSDFPGNLTLDNNEVKQKNKLQAEAEAKAAQMQTLQQGAGIAQQGASALKTMQGGQ